MLMNNVYDLAHNLGKAIKKSDEHKIYLENHKKVFSNNKTKEMVKNFRKMAMEVEMLQMSGKKLEREKLEQVQNLEDIIMKNPIINEYFQSEMRFSQMMNDIYKIIGDYIEIDLGLD